MLTNAEINELQQYKKDLIDYYHSLIEDYHYNDLIIIPILGMIVPKLGTMNIAE